MLHAVQDTALVPLVKLSAAQPVHTRSVAVSGVLETYVPAPHVDQLEQAPTFEVVENAPAAHAVQVRSTVAVGVFDTYVPAVHVCHGAQSVAPAPEKLSAPQDVQLPALVAFVNDPAEHGVHARSAVEEGVFET